MFAIIQTAGRAHIIVWSFGELLAELYICVVYANESYRAQSQSVQHLS